MAPVIVFGGMMKLVIVVVSSPEVGNNVGHLFLIPSNIKNKATQLDYVSNKKFGLRMKT
jgi:hypothetical protein